MSINEGMPWLLNVSQIISKKAPSATENNSVLSELSAKLPVFSCPSIIKSARTVWAIFVSYLFMIALVSNCLVPPVLRSSASYPCGRTSPSDSFLRRFFTMVISAPLILTMSGSWLSHISKFSGAWITGRPARSRSIPIASISWILRLKYQERYAFLKILRPSGLSFTLSVRNSIALLIGIVNSP